MLTLGGNLVLGIISIFITLYLSVEFMVQHLEEDSPWKSFKYLVLSIGNMLSLLFVVNVI
ncbi:TPA: hypothetical protein ACOTG0_001068 [Clostridium perfringens]